MTLVIGLIGAVFAAGVILCWSAFWEPLPPAIDDLDLPRLDIPWLAFWQIPAAVVVGIGGWMMSDWVSVGLGLAMLTLAGPALLFTAGAEADFASRTEAVAAWVESLRDTMRGARGVEAAVRVTADNAPIAIRGVLQRLNRRMSMGVPLTDAIAEAADEVANPVFDLVAAVLINALTVSSTQVPAMLDEIALQARERAHSHLQVHTSRTKQRTQLRLVGIIVVLTSIGFVLAFGSYLEPLASPAGQVVLSFAALSVGALLIWIAQLSAVPPAPRVLDPSRAVRSSRVGADGLAVAP